MTSARRGSVRRRTWRHTWGCTRDRSRTPATCVRPSSRSLSTSSCTSDCTPTSDRTPVRDAARSTSAPQAFGEEQCCLHLLFILKQSLQDFLLHVGRVRLCFWTVGSSQEWSQIIIVEFSGPHFLFQVVKFLVGPNKLIQLKESETKFWIWESITGCEY